jgi:hypothetical protein
MRKESSSSVFPVLQKDTIPTSPLSSDRCYYGIMEETSHLDALLMRLVVSVASLVSSAPGGGNDAAGHRLS